jgi:hypothetical protein
MKLLTSTVTRLYHFALSRQALGFTLLLTYAYKINACCVCLLQPEEGQMVAAVKGVLQLMLDS